LYCPARLQHAPNKRKRNDTRFFWSEEKERKKTKGSMKKRDGVILLPSHLVQRTLSGMSACMSTSKEKEKKG